MRIQLNFKSGKPVYLQLVDQVKAAAASGAMQRGRAAAVDPAARRGAARQPQHRRQGLRRAREPGRHRDASPARAASSAPNSSPFRKDVRLKLLAEEIDEAVVQAHHLQVGKADFLRLAEERFDAFDQQRGARPRAMRRHER